MRKLNLLLLLLVMSCCAAPSNDNQHREEKPKNSAVTKIIPYEDTPRGISVVVIDGCQYIYCETGSGVAITHKANCTNLIHD